MRRHYNIGLTIKLTLAVVISSVAVYLIIFAFDFSISKNIFLKNVDAFGESAVDETVHSFKQVEVVVEHITDVVQYMMEVSPIKNDRYYILLGSLLRAQEGLIGVSISYEPFFMGSDREYFSPSCFEPCDSIECKMLGGDGYDYFSMEWYAKVKKSGMSSWVEPYVDADFGDKYITSYSVPLYVKEGEAKKFIGVVSADVSLDWLQGVVSRDAMSRGGYAFLLSQKGLFVSHPQNQLTLKRTIWEIAKESKDENVAKVGREMTSRKRGVDFVIDPTNGERSWVFYAPIPASGWSVGAVFKESFLLADIVELKRQNFFLVAAGVCFLLLLMLVVSRRITLPLKQLSKAAEKISKGDLDAEVSSLGRHDEVGGLARSFKSMQTALKKYIFELTEATALKERLKNELKIAHDIQQSIVPKEFSVEVSKARVSIAGTLLPAREVGGDLYDCFATDDRHTCFVIGDVSDKGVHAALLMAVVQTMLRGLSKDLRHPNDILRLVNKEVLDRNKNSMFITLFCGILNTDTGKFRYANAGHVPPVLIRCGRDPEFLSDDPCVPLGVKPGANFSWQSIMLSRGDKVFMYTDGVTEAVNESEELFGPERMMNCLSVERKKTPDEILSAVFNAVTKYAGEREPADDIAMLAFSFDKDPVFKKKTLLDLKINGDESSVSDVSRKIREFAGVLNLGGEAVDDVVLAVEELLVNAIRFGSDDKSQFPIELLIEYEGDRLVVNMSDSGSPFNPLEAPPADTSLPLEKRAVGGLGIHFVRELMNRVDYERRENKNHVTLVKIL